MSGCGRPGFGWLAGIPSYQFVDLSQQGCSFSPNDIDGGQVVGNAWDTGTCHPSIWSSSAGSVVDLNPTGVAGYGVQAVCSGQQGGNGGGHALLWAGSADSVTDLHPDEYKFSNINGMGQAQQVGTVYTMSLAPHAALWSGTAGSFVDLTPASSYAEALGVYGNEQVGYGTTGTAYHALLWRGTPESVVDLHPAGYQESQACAVWDGQQVGTGFLSTFGSRALLWQGDAASVVDLTPGSFGYQAAALDVAGGLQVGWASASGTNSHAYVWAGSAASGFDLQTLLPAGFVGSQATAIDSLGNIVGFAHESDGTLHAVMWATTPEPASLLLFGIAAIGAMRRRRSNLRLDEGWSGDSSDVYGSRG